MRIIFAGTPDFACPTLEALINSDHKVVAVYTQPDRPKGRNRQLSPSPVKELAIANNIVVEQPINFKCQTAVDKFAKYKADVFIVAAYGLILPTTILELTEYNINVHASLLPKWRGAAPIQNAILAGDPITGVTIMEIVKELDAGAIINTASIGIADNITTAELSKKLSIMGADLIIETLDAMPEIWHSRVEQVDKYSSHAPKISKDMAIINWSNSAEQISRQIRALQPWPSTITQVGTTKLKILAIEIMQESDLNPGQLRLTSKQILVGTATNNVCLKKIQLASKPAMTAEAVICGNSDLFKEPFLQPVNENKQT